MAAASDMRALRIQSNVVGALILRELHTRFGRENIGYLWIFAEPLLLAVAVGLLHSRHQYPLSGNIRTIPFAVSGYTLFIMFRSTVSRAETLLEANRPLLNHRRVTILDMLVARAALELASTIVVLTLLLSAIAAFGFGEWLADPLKVALAVLLIAWFSFACSMLVAFLSHESHAFARLVHPVLYLSLPLSGAFFSMTWFSGALQDLLSWVPTVPIFELLRTGQFEGYPKDYAALTYPVACCGVLTLMGLAALKLMRRRVQV
jgi:capsular polysaccharide transport system permease protein